jgi:nucleotide-binding universal stress UspA family protein
MATGNSPTMLAGVANDEMSGPVVCGIDGPDKGRPLAAFAAGLAKCLGARLSAVHVEPGNSRSAAGLAALDRAGACASRRGHALLREALTEAEPERAVACKVGVGQPATTLVAMAAAEQAQLLVVGAGGRMSPAAALGPVPRELVMRAHCPVIVVPRAPASSGPPAWAGRRVLCAFDGSHDARRALSVAAAVAERLGALAFVAHVDAGGVRELQARARTERAALIVAASCGAAGWRAASAGSAPARLATSGAAPVLFVPPAYRPTPAARPHAAAAVRPIVLRPEPAKARA